MTLSLDTIIIFVRNVDQLKPFYTDILGLAILEEQPSEWLLLAAGNSKIGLHQIGKEYLNELQEKPKAHTNTKIVFDIGEDINQLRQALVAKNVKMRDVRTFDNYDYYVCDGEDPEGNVFQLKQKK